MCKMSINGEKMFNIHIKLNHEARSILKIGLKSRKPINECTPDYQKLKSKKLSSALRNVTGGDKSFRKLVFNNVCKDNEDLKDSRPHKPKLCHYCKNILSLYSKTI